jgi:hypothetical protein
MDDPKFAPPQEPGESDPAAGRPSDLDRVRDAVALGISDAEAGRVLDLDEAFDQLEAELKSVQSEK